MITITITPTTPAHMALLGKALLAMIESDSPLPTVDELFPLPDLFTQPNEVVAPEPEPEPARVATPVIAPAAAPVAAPVVELKPLTLEELRAKLARFDNTQLGPIFTALGCANLTALPPELYNTVLAQAEALTA
jgi:hypothetical protein